MKIWKWVDQHLEESLMCLLLTVMFLVMMAQVVLRTFGNSLSWAEELTRYCLICSGFLSLGYTVHKQTILKVDIVTSLLPQGMQRVLDLLLYLVTGLVFGFLLWESISLVGAIKATNQLSSALRFPIYLLYVSCVVGFLLGTLRCVQVLVDKLLHFRQVPPSGPQPHTKGGDAS